MAHELPDSLFLFHKTDVRGNQTVFTAIYDSHLFFKGQSITDATFTTYRVLNEHEYGFDLSSAYPNSGWQDGATWVQSYTPIAARPDYWQSVFSQAYNTSGQQPASLGSLIEFGNAGIWP